MSELVVLKPFKSNTPDTVSAIRITLEEDEVIQLGTMGLCLVIEAGKCSDIFKETAATSSVDEIIDAQAGDWNLGNQSAVLRPRGWEQALLLGPSVLGQTLYGGELPRADEGILGFTDPLRVKYGCIQTDYDLEEGKWGVNVIMPDLPYLTLTELTLVEG
jgi:hypothetical protein